LGNGNYLNQTTPVDITNYFDLLPGEKIIQIDLGYYHSMALTNLGNVYTWGINNYGQLGNFSTINSNIPINIRSYFNLSSLEIITKISAGYWHNGVITNFGNVYTWGYNSHGRLGRQTSYLHPFYSIPKNVTSQFNLGYGETITDLSLGGWHSMALSSYGTVYTWGNNSYGMLGNNLNKVYDNYVPESINPYLGLADGEYIKEISTGYNHSAALTNLGRLLIWGNSNHGQIGDGLLGSRSMPVDITQYFDFAEDEKIIKTSLGVYSSSIVTSKGRVFTWGYNEYGQIGDGTDAKKTTPYDVTQNYILNENEEIIYITYFNHLIFITNQSRIFTWGMNTSGQLGLGTYNYYRLPMELAVNHPDEHWISTQEKDDIFSVERLEKTGYIFNGWYLNTTDEIAFSIGIMPPNDLNLFGYWMLVEHDITYMMNDGENHVNNPNVYSIESGLIQLEEPTRLGYNFLGWYDNPGFDGEQVNSIDGS
jgi:uncharacterized repeat protein (TIGR02543 family)